MTITIKEYNEMTAEIERLHSLLREIWSICHIPADDPWPTYTLDHADFHRILALTKPFARPR